MQRRSFVRTLGAALGVAAVSSPAAACASAGGGGAGGGQRRRLRRIGVQLYSLRDSARRDLDRTLADLASVGYTDVEMLGSMNNFNTPPARVREMLDRHKLRAPSSHVGGNLLDTLERQLDDAQTIGHEYLIIAGLPRLRTLDEYRAWTDRVNEAGRVARGRGVWIGFHNHASDMTAVEGAVPYDVMVERADPSVTRLQLDVGNMAMSGRDPHEYLRRYGNRYWSFHVKDVPRMGANSDAELGKGVIDLRRLLAGIDRIDEKLLFVEQENYPGEPLDSVRRDYQYLSTLEF